MGVQFEYWPSYSAVGLFVSKRISSMQDFAQ